MISLPNQILEAELNDERLTRRLNIIIPQLKDNWTSTIPEAIQSKEGIKGAYRFFRNPKVEAEKLISAHLAALNLQSSSDIKPRYLCLSDSTELDYTGKRGAKHLGPLSYLKQRGIVLHNSMIIKDNGVVVGIHQQDYIIRNEEDFGKSEQRERLPIEQKESIKWLNHFNACQQTCQDQQVEMVYIADREADIMEIYHARSYEDMHFVIRSQHNRCLHGTKNKLYEVLKAQPLIGTYKLEVIDHETSKARTAIIAIRFCKVELQLTTRSKHKKHLGVNELTAVEAYEINPPEDVKNPVRWVLLTSLPVNTFQDAFQIVQYYVFRWLIERFFYLLKSGGANIEQLQMTKPHQLKNAIATYSIVAMDAMKIRYLAQNNPDISVSEAGITPVECEVLYSYANKKVDKTIKFNPKQPPTVKEFCIVLGRIGGFIPSKRQPLPGLRILSRALKKFHILLDAYDSFMSKNSEKDVGYQ